MQIIEKYFTGLTAVQIQQFDHLENLYTYWNQRINVISRKDIEHLQVHHILHSLAIAKVIGFKSKTVIIDAGTGGGFPGIPLAIMFPEARFILADSIRKKITVVNEVIRETRLTNCETRNMRLEDIHDKADFVVSRAVAEISQLYVWTRKNIVPGGKNALKNGLLALKGGDLSSEISFDKIGKIYDLKDYYDEPFFESKKLVYVPA